MPEIRFAPPSLFMVVEFRPILVFFSGFVALSPYSFFADFLSCLSIQLKPQVFQLRGPDLDVLQSLLLGIHNELMDTANSVPFCQG